MRGHDGTPRIIVRKADGSHEPFHEEKLVKSLRRAGASDEVIQEILTHLAAHHYGEMTSQQIYEHAFRRLKQHEPFSAARYSLRRALFSLGPTGFPFEDFIAEVFRAQGYVAQAGVRMQGKCLDHEIDLVAERGNTRVFAELKFHNDPSQRTDVKVALYVQARFADLESHARTLAQAAPYLLKKMLITNTKFTQSAIRYASCVGLSLLGWSYPPKGNLRDLIEETRTIPITTLVHLTQTEKDALLARGVLLCRTLLEHPETLEDAGISKTKHDTILDESRYLCGGGRGVYTRW
ncbi:ATPase [Candidatus Parcubacteria bacterium]|nr:MAG: ATPase [Candidatus Parcubacteria bacterium]